MLQGSFTINTTTGVSKKSLPFIVKMYNISILFRSHIFFNFIFPHKIFTTYEVNIRENPKGNQELTIQRHWKRWEHKTGQDEGKQDKTQYIKWWAIRTPPKTWDAIYRKQNYVLSVRKPKKHIFIFITNVVFLEIFGCLLAMYYKIKLGLHYLQMKKISS